MARHDQRDNGGKFAKPKSETQRSIDAMAAKAADGGPVCLWCHVAIDQAPDPNCPHPELHHIRAAR